MQQVFFIYNTELERNHFSTICSIIDEFLVTPLANTSPPESSVGQKGIFVIFVILISLAIPVTDFLSASK